MYRPSTDSEASSSEDDEDLDPLLAERSSRQPRSSSGPNSRSSSVHPAHPYHPLPHLPLHPSLPRPSPAISLRALPPHDPLHAFKQDTPNTHSTHLTNSPPPTGRPSVPPSASTLPSSSYKKEDYERYLDFPIDFLASMLTPKLELCQQRFELVVDDLCFIGHPMRRGNGAEGSWAMNEEDMNGSIKPSTSGGSVAELGRGRSKGSRSGTAPGPGVPSEQQTSAVPASMSSSANFSIGTAPSTTTLEDVQEGSSLTPTSLLETRPTNSSTSASTSTDPWAVRSSIRQFKSHADNTIIPTGLISNSGNADVDVDGPPYINHFHVVVVVDMPSTSARGRQSLPNSKLSALYKEVIFKLTAALYDAQVSDNWVAKQSRDLRVLKEKCEHVDKIPFEMYLQQALQISPLARALKQVYEAIKYFPFATTVKIASLPLYVQLPLPLPSVDMDWIWWEDSIRDDQDQGYDLTIGASGNTSSSNLAPWKGLLLLDEPGSSSPPFSGHSSRVNSKVAWEDQAEPFDRWDKASSGGRSRAASSMGWSCLDRRGSRNDRGSGSTENSTILGGPTLGLGSTMTAMDQNDLMNGSRNPSIRTGDQKEDIGDGDLGSEEEAFPLFSMFLDAIKPSLSLADIARLPQFVDLQVDLERDLYPMAKILVWKRKAKIIYPVKPGTRNVYFPCTNQGKEFKQIKEDFDLTFPQLAPLLGFLSRISAAPVAYASINPFPKDSTMKRIYYEALLWLRRRDMVVGAPVRVRLIARREIKELARRMQIDRSRPRRKRNDNDDDEQHDNNNDSDASSDENTNADADDEDPELGHELLKTLFDDLEDTIIKNPAECFGQEKAWIQAICKDHDVDDAAIFLKICQYFNGRTSVQEMCYREDLSRKEVSRVLKVFEKDITINIHP
ncbi:Uncharacterized conserved protein [Phaffia rhodozyma]|uniref:Nitrogen permease regulator 3 n=1 Tax=Phaffia rhodozyma TaxID=264483 RepID=A0A0F7SF60_PHARH|nr:Uncharacterized conserved protein [Phaffia rhodozyma]